MIGLQYLDKDSLRFALEQIRMFIDEDKLKNPLRYAHHNDFQFFMEPFTGLIPVSTPEESLDLPEAD